MSWVGLQLLFQVNHKVWLEATGFPNQYTVNDLHCITGMYAVIAVSSLPTVSNEVCKHQTLGLFVSIFQSLLSQMKLMLSMHVLNLCMSQTTLEA